MCRATFELTALVAHVQDADAASAQDAVAEEGHLIAHIKVQADCKLLLHVVSPSGTGRFRPGL